MCVCSLQLVTAHNLLKLQIIKIESLGVSAENIFFFFF